MDIETCETCITKFRSKKETDDPRGIFGLGILSPGHDPAQSEMTVISKTKNQDCEIHIFGNITSEPDIELSWAKANNKSTGTTVIVEFQKNKDFSLRDLLTNLKDYAAEVLKYVVKRFEDQDADVHDADSADQADSPSPTAEK